MDLEELLRKANDGDMTAQYELAEHYGRLLKETENEDEIYKYSLDAMLWLKKSARQGYGPALEALSELGVHPIAESGEAAVSGNEKTPDDTEPEADDETVAAVAAAVMESTAEVADVGRSREDSAAPDEEGENTEGSRVPGRNAASPGTTALFVMLVISLLLNALLLVFLFRMSRDGQSARTVPTPSPAAEATMTPEPTPRPTPEPTEEPTPEPTPEATPEPTPEPFWLDLSRYPKLELKPNEDMLYEDYEYYIVTAGSTLNMRSGPDTRYERIGTIPSLAKVGAVSQYGKWYLVEYEGELGWVHGSYLTDDMDYGRPAANSSSGDLTVLP